ncbi:MAG TPA: hypothetical protein VME63_05370 [Dyella sp.]|uniref:hypothetical protein n=1 Tax=Dyella sp. TaxID=1869338 RepID=UPI002CF3A042|nr:hypothetical protein [Dyella sp.]HTV84811.1 hypothetical protein [Dyella sp.]
MIPTLITTPIRLHAIHTGTNALATLGWIMAIAMLASLLLMPIYAGYLQMIDATERGLPTRARDIFKLYAQGEALRVIGYGVVQAVVYVAFFALILTTVGGDVLHWYAQVLQAQATHQPPATTLPAGFGTTFLLIMVGSLLLMGFHSIGLGQVALRRRNVFAAFGDGVIGTLKNVLPLVVYALCVLLSFVAVGLVFALVVLVLTVIGKFVGLWLMFVLLVPLYIALLLFMFSSMFGMMYYLWRDVCGDDVVAGPAETVAA